LSYGTDAAVNQQRDRTQWYIAVKSRDGRLAWGAEIVET